MPPVLELRAATKSFHGVPAIKDVNFTLEKGEIHAIVGENGAGKSTLTKVICGIYNLTSGKISVDGKPTVYSSPSGALDRGFAMVFQETNLVPSMTVAQNLYLGDEKLFNRLRGLYIHAQQLLQSLNFDVDPTAPVSSLGAAHKQMVEIARAIRRNARVIIFDEPTASLTPEEKHHFFSLLDRLKAQDVSIIFISHMLEEALAVSDRITILRDGRLVVTDLTSKFDRDRIIQAMVGRNLSDDLYHRPGAEGPGRRSRGARVLSVENLSMGSMVRNTSFSIFGGQITGIFGLIGAGRTEMMKIVAGIMKRDIFHGGVVRLGARTKRYRVPRPAVLDGIVYVTEDRKQDGFFDTFSIADNIYIGKLTQGWNPLAIASRAQIRKAAAHWSEALSIRAISSDARMVELSGGNQQKVVIAKALIKKPKLVIFDEPTRGVDVGSIAEIHKFIESLADSGIAVVVISSYLPEILALSDRILVARQGRIVEEMDIAQATEKTIMYAAVF